MQASASAQAALEQLAIEQERSGELAARVQELAATQVQLVSSWRTAGVAGQGQPARAAHPIMASLLNPCPRAQFFLSCFLSAAQEAAAMRFRDVQEELELERTRNSSLLVCE